jgi:hypothetical protein
MNRPRWLHFVGLAVVMGAYFWLGNRENSSVVVSASRDVAPRSVGAVTTEEGPLALARLARRKPSGTDLDPFPAKTWYVAPPPPPAPPPAEVLPPPKPTAPPLPFQYMGKLEEPESGKLVIYLAKGSESFSVSAGDTFDGVYRLDGVQRNKLRIFYLPLAIKQTLVIGSDIDNE